MKISIITVCFNSCDTLEDTFLSVKRQKYSSVEYIVVDGGSTDGSVELIRKYRDLISKYVSEPDLGVYDAMNKGIFMATGDVIGILNSDDVFTNEDVLKEISNYFTEDIDGVYGDVVFCKRDNVNELTRYYSSQSASIKNLKRGIMPAHPALYLRRRCYEELGGYSLDYKIAGDFDFVVRLFCNNKSRLLYVKSNFVKMRGGGVSTSGLSATYRLNKEILLSLRKNGIYSNWLWLISKYPMKILGIFKAMFWMREKC